MRHYKIVLVLLSLFVLSCKKDKDEATPEFDKKQLLTNYGTNVILPTYDNFDQSISQLEITVNDFISVSNQTNLQVLRSQFFNAYEAWEACSFIDFGPSNNYTLKAICNTYPIDTTLINSNISSGSYILGAASNTTAIGFPALDFLLFPDTSLSIALSKINGVNSSNKKQYILDLVKQIKGGISSTLSSWQGSHLATFINSDGNGQGSSLSEMVNAMNLDFEKFTRDGKIGIPLGIRSLGTPLPTKTESFYSKHSLVLFKESIQKLQHYFNGESSSNIGLDDYLNHLNDNNNVARLSVKINNQFDVIIEKANLITNPISIAVNTEQAKVQDLYNELQKMVVLLKVDMSSALSILITYQDNDGD